MFMAIPKNFLAAASTKSSTAEGLSLWCGEVAKRRISATNATSCVALILAGGGDVGSVSSVICSVSNSAL